MFDFTLQDDMMKTAFIFLLLATLTSCTGDNFRRNNLGKENSEYLLQHKNNPVWWQAWNESTLKEAKEKNKVIFLSIGYSTCHWCHVMEKEVFENAEIARKLNQDFIAIKVDREERPDIDKIYMDALNMMRQGGGWPLNMFLTPDLKPFVGFTYMNKEKFVELLPKIERAWRKSPDDAIKVGTRILETIQKRANAEKEKSEANLDLDEKYLTTATKAFDRKYGGFGNSPKFPPANKLKVLMNINDEKNKSQLIVKKTLDDMFKGSIYDHIGGGFHRYSTDRKWETPHYEKMLYDNASMLEIYTNAHLKYKNYVYKHAAMGISDYVLAEMTDTKDGGYFSAQDADSEGKEGKFYLWQYLDIAQNIETSEFKVLSDSFVFPKLGDTIKKFSFNLIDRDFPSEEKFKKMKPILEKLKKLRSKRVAPLKDEKKITAWNGLMIHAMARAGFVFKNESYLNSAIEAAKFIADEHLKKNELYRRTARGKAEFNGVLDDYAYLSRSYITLFQVTGDQDWLNKAISIQNTLDTVFWSEKKSGYYYSKQSNDQITRYVEFNDNARPNANSMVVSNLLNLYFLTMDKNYKDRVEKILSTHIKSISNWPLAFPELMLASQMYRSTAKQVVLAFQNKIDFNHQFFEHFRQSYLPHSVLIPMVEGKSKLAFLKDKKAIKGKPTAYVCLEGICNLPTSDFNTFKKQIEE